MITTSGRAAGSGRSASCVARLADHVVPGDGQRARPSRKSTESSPITIRTAVPPRRVSHHRAGSPLQRSPASARHPIGAVQRAQSRASGGSSVPSSVTVTSAAIVADPHHDPLASSHTGQRWSPPRAGHVVGRGGHVGPAAPDPHSHVDRHRQRLVSAPSARPARRPGCSVAVRGRSGGAPPLRRRARRPHGPARRRRRRAGRWRCASRSAMPRATSRCWAPSCRSRSSRAVRSSGRDQPRPGSPRPS